MNNPYNIPYYGNPLLLVLSNQNDCYKLAATIELASIILTQVFGGVTNVFPPPLSLVHANKFLHGLNISKSVGFIHDPNMDSLTRSQWPPSSKLAFVIVLILPRGVLLMDRYRPQNMDNRLDWDDPGSPY